MGSQWVGRARTKQALLLRLQASSVPTLTPFTGGGNKIGVMESQQWAALPFCSPISSLIKCLCSDSCLCCCLLSPELGLSPGSSKVSTELQGK